MKKFTVAQPTARTGVMIREANPQIGISARYHGFGDDGIRAAHRAEYTAADAQAICDWLNDRAMGYQSKERRVPR